MTGTWTQEDTLDAPLDPANANRYVFTGDDPINQLDPTGAYDKGACNGDIIGLVTGIVVFGIGVFTAPTGIGLVALGLGAVGTIAAGLRAFVDCF